MSRRLCRAALVVLTLPMFGAAAAAEWKWTLTPYIWLTDVGIDVSINERQVVNTTIDVKDLAEDLEMIFQVHVEGQPGVNGLLLDIFYVKLSDDPKTVPIQAGPGGTAVVNAEFDMTIFEAGGIFDAKGDYEGLQLLYGARVIDLRANIDAQFTLGGGPPSSRSFDPGDRVYDGLLGGRWVKRFGKGWSTSLRADVSAGGTKFTWNANTTLAYAWGKDGRYAVTGGYRYMDIEFKEEDSIETELTLSGPAIGFRFTF